MSKLAATINFPNTIIPCHIVEVKKYSVWWQTHLEHISDFLLPGKGVWWRYNQEHNEVEFFDSASELSSRNEGPLLHHFRSSSLKLEESYLKECWEECIQQDTTLPAHFLFQPNADGKVIKKVTGFLSDEFNTTSNEVECSLVTEQSIIEYEEDTLDVDDDRVTDVCLVQDQELCFDEIVTAESNNQDADQSHELNTNSSDNGCDQETATSHHVLPLHVDNPIDEYSCSNSSYLCQVNPTCEPPKVTRPINTTESRTCSERKVKTKLGKAVEIVLGPSTDLFNFDKARDLLKKNIRCKEAVKNYEYQQALIQIKVLAKEKELNFFLKEWEKLFFINHCRTATMEEMKNDKSASEY